MAEYGSVATKRSSCRSRKMNLKLPCAHTPMRPHVFVGLFAAVFCFLLLTFPSNHSEAEDAYSYALAVEQGGAAELFHMHHLLYLPLMKGLFAVAGFLGYAGRAFPLLIGFSMLAGAFSICLFAGLTGGKKTGVFFAAALLFSYGFWRYSTTAEIYVPVTALSLLALICARRAEENAFFFWGSVLCGSAALLMHVASWPLVLGALPFLYLANRRAPRAVAYLVAVPLITAGVYISVISGPGLTVFSDTQVVRETLLSPRVWVKGAAAWSQNVASGNFLFSIEPVVEKIRALFPYHMLQEEIFMGKMAPRWVGWAASGTFVFVVLAVLSCLLFVFRAIRQGGLADWAWPATLLLWLGGTAATALIFEPANPEMWICTLAPFWLLMSVLWDRLPEPSVWARRVPAVLVAALLFHNFMGGMSLVASPEKDYCRQKTEWVVREAQPNDVILMADSQAAVTFLRYQTPAQVVDAKFITPDAWQNLKSRAEGRIFVFGDVLDLLPPVARRAPESVKQIQQTVELFEQDLKRVHQDGLGTVYQCL